MRKATALTTLIWLICATTTFAMEKDYLHAFPEATKDQVRFVLRLPHKDRETEGDFRVEIFVGKVMQTDGVNRYWMGSEVEQKPLKGWGFHYYVLDEFGPVASTKMGVPPGTEKKDEFVHGKSLMTPYNSRVPIVIYAPKGSKVLYRIWSAGERQTMDID